MAGPGPTVRAEPRGRGLHTANPTPMPDLTQGLCTQPGQHPELWQSTDPGEVAVAQAICGICPARVPCGEHALEHEETGVWGGLTWAERHHIRNQIRDAR